MRRGDVWWLGVHPDVIKDLPDLRAHGNECDEAHLPAAFRAQQRLTWGFAKNLVDARYEHGPR